MAIGVTLAVAPSAPASGAIVTATYNVTGNSGTPAGTPVVIPIAGSVEVAGTEYAAAGEVTVPGVAAVPPLAVTYGVPTCLGLTFAGTANPAVFTGVVP